MEALGLLKFWRNTSADDEDSFFDLDFESPRDGDLKKDFEFIESPRDVLQSKNDYPSSPVTVLRSVPKFKVFMLGFRKSSKCDNADSDGELNTSPLNQLSKSSKLNQSNRFSFKCISAGDVPATPVFTRDNSLRSKMLKETACDAVSTEKSSLPKYLKLMKPLYAKVSNKSKSTSVTPSLSPVNLSPRKLSEGSRVGSFKMATRNFGKSRSASASVEVAPPPVRRSDDYLREQNDGIQGAILHCKKSFNSEKKRHSI